MPDHEAPVRAFYDHELEEPRPAGRRRRPVADWGVGEDVFDRMPSRRFARPEHARPDPRARGHEEGPRHEIRETAGRHPRTTVVEGDAGGPRSGRFAGGDEAAEPTREIVVSGDVGEMPGGDVEQVVEAAPREGRRTVVISGHPERLPAPRPRRPPRTAVERVGARPDRIVAYAVALGVLLILIAILTTGQ